MDEWTKNHCLTWVTQQFPHDDEAAPIFERMQQIFNEDAEYWSRQDYWRLYEASKAA